MSTKLPYVNRPSSMVRVLEKVKEAKTPDRFTQDFLKTVLGFKGGNYNQFVPLAKKLGLLNTDGSPTDIYKQFRNSGSSEAAMAKAIKIGYEEIFSRNENANTLTNDQLKGLVVEITGEGKKSEIVRKVCKTFEELSTLANFDEELNENEKDEEPKGGEAPRKDDSGEFRDFDMNLSYTINLVLPKTDDPAVFSAIFKSLRDHLLRK